MKSTEVGMLLRASKHAGSGSFASAIARASKFRGSDGDDYRAEFIKLARPGGELARTRSDEAVSVVRRTDLQVGLIRIALA